jgi:hypothetical protein
LLSSKDRSEILAARFVLAPGLERLMKLSVMLNAHNHGTPVTDPDVRDRFRHDLLKLRAALVDIAADAPGFRARRYRETSISSDATRFSSVFLRP